MDVNPKFCCFCNLYCFCFSFSSTITNGNAGLNNTSLYRQDMNSPVFTARAQQYQNYFTNSISSSTAPASNASPTDLSMKQQPATTTMMQQTPLQQQSQQTMQPLQQVQNQQQLQQQQVALPPPPTAQQQQQRPPLLSHKLNPSEINAVRQLVTGYRESAAFLLRSADELETLLLNQNNLN